jgi:hypothetical protein
VENEFRNTRARYLNDRPRHQKERKSLKALMDSKKARNVVFLEEIIRSLGENPFKTIASYNIADPTCLRKLKEGLSLEKRF